MRRDEALPAWSIRIDWAPNWNEILSYENTRRLLTSRFEPPTVESVLDNIAQEDRTASREAAAISRLGELGFYVAIHAEQFIIVLDGEEVARLDRNPQFARNAEMLIEDWTK